MESYINGVITDGDHFTYQGVRYGKYTKVLFTEEFYKRHKEIVDLNKYYGWKFPYFRTFSHVKYENGKTVWCFGKKDIFFVQNNYTDIDFEKDIEKIVTPVWYYEPKELVKKRLNEGSWILYVWPQTLFYLICLLVSPIFQEWYLIWTIGLYIYLRLCYIRLSKGELNRGWQN